MNKLYTALGVAYKTLGVVLTLLAVGYLSTPAMAQTSIRRYNAHITTNTTTTVTSTTAYISSIVINIAVAGAASNTLTVQNKEGTAKKLFGPIDTTTVGIKVNSHYGGLISAQNGGMIVATSGIDIVTATGTAPTADVFITYYL